MKSFNFLKFFILSFFLCLCMPLIGQVIDPLIPEGGNNPFLELYDPIYSFILLIMGYLAKKYDNFSGIADTWLKVAAIGIVTGLGFIVNGSTIWQMLVSFGTTSGIIYQLIGLFFKVKKPELE